MSAVERASWGGSKYRYLFRSWRRASATENAGNSLGVRQFSLWQDAYRRLLSYSVAWLQPLYLYNAPDLGLIVSRATFESKAYEDALRKKTELWKIEKLNIIWVIKLRITRWAELVSRVKEIVWNGYKIVSEKLKEKDLPWDLAVCRRVILCLNLEKYIVRRLAGLP